MSTPRSQEPAVIITLEVLPVTVTIAITATTNMTITTIMIMIMITTIIIILIVTVLIVMAGNMTTPTSTTTTTAAAAAARTTRQVSCSLFWVHCLQSGAGNRCKTKVVTDMEAAGAEDNYHPVSTHRSLTMRRDTDTHTDPQGTDKHMDTCPAQLAAQTPSLAKGETKTNFRKKN
jgi:hypothetical protein